MARMNKLESIVKGMVEVKFIFTFLNVSWSLPLFINFLSGASPSLSFVIICLSQILKNLIQVLNGPTYSHKNWLRFYRDFSGRENNAAQN